MTCHFALLLALWASGLCVCHSLYLPHRKELGLALGSSDYISDDYGDCIPREVHLALGDGDGSMRIMWRTTSATCSAFVNFGRLDDGSRSDNSSLNGVPRLRQEGSTRRVTEGLMCSKPAKDKPFRVIMHEVLISDLAHAAGYWYQIEGDSRQYTFMSPLRPGSADSFSFLAFGDMGESTYKRAKSRMAQATASAMEHELDARPCDFVLHMGDLAYADGKYKVWDSFMQLIEPIASRVPYMVGVGNHEYDYAHGRENDPSGEQPYHPGWGNYGDESGGECGAMIAGRFSMPNRLSSMPNSAANAPFWYSYEYANMHFTLISTEHDISPGSRQYNWLESDLRNVDRCRTPWLVVGLHRPMYVVYPHKDNRIVGEHLRDYLEDLLVKYQVDFTLSGHVHTYYRTCNAYDAQCRDDDDDKGITHFVIGTGGHNLSEADEDDQRGWLGALVNDWGVGRFDVEGDEMRMQFLRATDNSVADQITLRSKVSQHDACQARLNSGTATAASAVLR